MWVDVVCLRRDGNKLAQHEVRAAVPLRARLTVDTVVVKSASGEPARRAEVAQLWPSGESHGDTPLGTLEYANVSRVGGAGLMVVGVEPARSGPARPQAWWCRIVLDGAADDMPSEWRHTWPGSMPAPLTDIVVHRPMPAHAAATPRA